MKIQYQRRAEIALRYIPPNDLRSVQRALDMIAQVHPKDLIFMHQIRKLKQPNSSPELFSFRASHKYRIIFSVYDETLVVEDVISADSYKGLGD